MSVQRIVPLAAILLLLTAHPLAAACGTPTFTEATSVDTGDSYNANVAVADLNHDNFPDFVVGSTVTDDVRVFLGNGDGTYQPYVSYPAADAGLVVIDDVNNDTHPDIVVNTANTSIGVLLNASNGTFGSMTTYTATLNLVGSIATGDFNGDHRPDLLVTDIGSGVTIFWNNGSGGFPTRINWSVPGNAGDAAPGDFNEDGMTDVAVVYGDAANGSNPGTLAIFLNTNNGNFPTTANNSYALPAPGTNSEYDLAVADFNNNGHVDVLVSKYDGFKLFLGSGSGTFSAGGSMTLSPSDFRDVAAADFNEDGKMDAVFAGNNGSTVLVTGTGNGNFNAPFYIEQFSGNHSNSIATADLNFDGRPDFLILETGGSRVRPYLNACHSQYTTMVIEASANPSTYPETVTLQVKVIPRGGNTRPTGTVTLSLSNGTVIGTQDVLAGTTPQGVATFTLNLKPGSYNLTAAYSGDGTYAANTITNYGYSVNRPASGAPLELVATGSGSSITLRWIGTQAAASYDILRKSSGTWVIIANTASEVYTDSAIDNLRPYVYAVQGRSASNEVGPMSNADVGSTYVYTSNPLSIGATVKAIDVNELRTQINFLRTAVGLGGFAFTDPTLTAGMVIKAVHLTELRTALAQALSAVAIPAPTYSQPTITPHVTIIRRADQQELRNAMN